jgi:hypothetical protein
MVTTVSPAIKSIEDDCPAKIQKHCQLSSTNKLRVWQAWKIKSKAAINFMDATGLAPALPIKRFLARDAIKHELQAFPLMSPKELRQHVVHTNRLSVLALPCIQSAHSSLLCGFAFTMHGENHITWWTHKAIQLHAQRRMSGKTPAACTPGCHT